MKKTFILLALATSFLSSCEKDKEEITNEVGNLTLVFDNIVGEENLRLENKIYSNTSGESYTVNELKYIISNIELTAQDNTIFVVPVEDSYFVIDEVGNKTASITGIPAGDYKNITFGFGVDPTKYPIASGSMNFIPTAEEAGMLWNWSAGYKFLKFEGTFLAPGQTGEADTFTYHVGSHGANLDNYKEVSLATAKTISADTEASQKITFDVAKIFDSTNTLSLSNKSDIQVDPENAPLIAQNTSTAFEVNN